MTDPGRSPFRLIVFDWDGTLLDSIASIVGCAQATFERLGLPRASESAIRGTIGMGLREAVELLLPRHDEELFERVLSTYRHFWLQSYGQRAVLFEGARQTLERLRRAGYALAVATAKPWRGLRPDFDRTGVESYFQVVKTVDDAPPKPHPGILLEVLREAETEPAEALMVGDTTHDLDMARGAGVSAVAVTSGSQPRDVLLEREPMGCLEGVSQLPNWLDNRASATGSTTGSSGSE